jgi:hypothetical protein
MIGERPHLAQPRLDGAERQVPRDLLTPPAVQHRLEDLLIRPQQRHPGNQVQPRSAGPRLAHSLSTSDPGKQMRESRIRCETTAKAQVSGPQPTEPRRPTRTTRQPGSSFYTTHPQAIAIADRREIASDAIRGAWHKFFPRCRRGRGPRRGGRRRSAGRPTARRRPDPRSHEGRCGIRRPQRMQPALRRSVAGRQSARLPPTHHLRPGRGVRIQPAGGRVAHRRRPAAQPRPSRRAPTTASSTPLGCAGRHHRRRSRSRTTFLNTIARPAPAVGAGLCC